MLSFPLLFYLSSGAQVLQHDVQLVSIYSDIRISAISNANEVADETDPPFVIWRHRLELQLLNFSVEWCRWNGVTFKHYIPYI